MEVSSEKLEIFGKENRAVYSGQAVAVRDTTTIRCDQIHVFYAEGQQITRIEAVGNVEVTDQDRVAKGERADFDNLTGVLVMTGNPEAYQGPNRVTGTQVTLTTGEDRVEVENARTLLEDAPTPGKRSRVRINAPRLVILGKKNRAVWSGRVRTYRGDARIDSDRLVAHYDEKGQDLTRIEAFKNVQVFDGDRWARGEYADFDNRSGVLVMTGNPEARQGVNRMRGTKVTFTMGTDTLKVDNAQSVFETHKGVPQVLEEKRQ